MQGLSGRVPDHRLPRHLPAAVSYAGFTPGWDLQGHPEGLRLAYGIGELLTGTGSQRQGKDEGAILPVAERPLVPTGEHVHLA